MARLLSAFASNVKDALVGPGPSDQDRVQELWFSFESHRDDVVQMLEAAGEIDKDFGEACQRSGLDDALTEMIQGIADYEFELLDAAIEEDVFRKLAALAHENKPVGLRSLVLGGLCTLFEAADLGTKAKLFGHARLRQPLIRTMRAATTLGSGVSASPARGGSGSAGARRRRAVRLQLERSLMKNRLRLARSVWQVVATHPALLDGLGPSKSLGLQSLIEPAVALAGHTGSAEGEAARLALLDAASCADPRVDAALLGLGAANVLAGSTAALLGELPTAPSTWAAVQAVPPLPSAMPSAHAAVDPVVQRAGDASEAATGSQRQARADLLKRLEQLAGHLQYLQSLVAVSSLAPTGDGGAEGGFGWRLAAAFEDQVCRRVLIESLLPEATSDPSRALVCTCLTALLLALEAGPPDCMVRRALCLALLQPGGVVEWASTSSLTAAASASAVPLIAAASAGLRGRPDLSRDRPLLQRFLKETLESRTGQLLRRQDPGYNAYVSAARPAAVALSLAAPLPPVEAQGAEMQAAARRAGVVLQRQLERLLEAPAEVGLAVTGAISAAVRGNAHPDTLRALLAGGGADDNSGAGGAAGEEDEEATGNELVVPLPLLLPQLLVELRRRAAAMPDFAEALKLARKQAGVHDHVAVDGRWGSAEAELLADGDAAPPANPPAPTPAHDLALAPAPVGSVLLLEFVKEIAAFAEALRESAAQTNES